MNDCAILNMISKDAELQVNLYIDSVHKVGNLKTLTFKTRPPQGAATTKITFTQSNEKGNFLGVEC